MHAQCFCCVPLRRRYVDRLHQAISDIERWNLVNPLEQVVTMMDIYRRVNELGDNLSDQAPAAECSKLVQVGSLQHPQHRRQPVQGVRRAFMGGGLLRTPPRRTHCK